MSTGSIGEIVKRCSVAGAQRPRLVWSPVMIHRAFARARNRNRTPALWTLRALREMNLFRPVLLEALRFRELREVETCGSF